MPALKEELTGVFDHVKWAADDGSHIIAGLQDGKTVVGPTRRDSFITGVTYTFSGRYNIHPTYGKQFKFDAFVQCEPITESQITAYLLRHLAQEKVGIGEAKAKRLATVLGPQNCLQIMKTDPRRVSEVAAIPLLKAEKVASILTKVDAFEKTTMRLTEMLKDRGFSRDLIDKAIEDMGVLAYDVIKRDPFTMLVRGYPSAGFQRCDKLYRDGGRPEKRLKRQLMCIWDYIKSSGGSTWVLEEDAIEELRRLVSSDVAPERAVELGLRTSWLQRREIEKKPYLAVTIDAYNEDMLADNILRLMECDL